MTKDQVIGMQTMLKKTGFDPGPIDGIAGPRTKAAYEAWDAATKAEALRRHDEKVIQATSTSTKWPKQSDVPSFFGAIEIGKDGLPTDRWQSRYLTTIRTPYRLRLSWDTETTVDRIRCHKQVARDLSAILDEILAHYGSPESVKAARMDLYGGCYNFRRMRGGPALSMHSYGIAIDFDPDRNGLGVKFNPNTGMMPEAVVEIFKRRGWTWGGHWRTPDAMHFQAATI